MNGHRERRIEPGTAADVLPARDGRAGNQYAEVVLATSAWNRLDDLSGEYALLRDALHVDHR